MSSPVHIIYASTSGNVEAVVGRIAEVWEGSAILHRAENVSVDVIKDNEIFLLATSTWEHGEINPRFEKLMEAMDELNLTGKKFMLVGLGDRRYEPVLFCRGIEILQELVTARGGGISGDVLKIDGSPYQLLDNIVTEWAKRNQPAFDE